MAEFTQEQTVEFARSYFQEEAVVCPTCDTPLSISESGANRGWHAVGVLFECRRCIASAFDDGRERAQASRPYTNEEKAQILDASWKGLRPRCPEDESYLDIQKTALVGG